MEEQTRRYGRQAAVFPPLTAEQQELVRRHTGLVGIHMKTRVPTPWQPHRHREYEDLFQEGCLALARAAASYRPERHGVFAAYALPRIRSAIHLAIYNRFAVVRIPMRAIQKMREQIADPKLRPPHHVQEITPDLEKAMLTNSQNTTDLETIRHVLRQRLERAVERAISQVRARRWPRRNPAEIMLRIARERLLIDDGQRRTPLRRLARESGISRGRASDYEKHLVQSVQRLLADDPQAHELNRMAHEDPAGLEGLVDPPRRERLVQSEVAGFARRFEEMTAAERAHTIYSMLERTASCVPEVAKNLFCLNMRDDSLCELPAA